jgi:cellulose synthase/poly-beta-1,6-N-acetylglucosamine synthase-like glycosyltransferase
MNVIPFARHRATASAATAAWAASSVPEALSARGLRVPLWAALCLPLALCVAALVPGASYILAPAFALAAAFRLAALGNLLLRPPTEPPPLPDAQLPTLTILLPLYKEAAVLPDLVAAMGALDYPRHLIQIIVLLEEADTETRGAAGVHVPKGQGWQVIVVPRGKPQTKPRAVNVGLAAARGEVVVIYDGEDRPEVDQARRAVAALMADQSLAVVQCALACDHGGPWFTVGWRNEYAVLFGAILPVLSRLGLPFLFGGTSQFLRTKAVMEAGAYDASNTTEDADLAVSMARLGHRSAFIPSVTFEEAPVTIRAFLHQRRRWIAGHIITAVVHLRSPVQTWRQVGPAGSLALLAQLPVATLSTAAHPLGFPLLAQGDLHGALGAVLALGYGAAVALVWATSRSPWAVFMLPAYWCLHVAALVMALHDVVRCPQHWFKTSHGLAARPAVSHPPQTCHRQEA